MEASLITSSPTTPYVNVLHVTTLVQLWPSVMFHRSIDAAGINWLEKEQPYGGPSLKEEQDKVQVIQGIWGFYMQWGNILMRL